MLYVYMYICLNFVLCMYVCKKVTDIVHCILLWQKQRKLNIRANIHPK